MSIRSRSSEVNKSVLKQDLGLKQLSNTTVFTKSQVFVLSPSMQNAHNWFDCKRPIVHTF